MLVMKKYKKREPDIVEAIQFTGENKDEILKALNANGSIYHTIVRGYDEEKEEKTIEYVQTLGIVTKFGYTSCAAMKGDYVIKTADGELDTLNEDWFLIDYEETE